MTSPPGPPLPPPPGAAPPPSHGPDGPVGDPAWPDGGRRDGRTPEQAFPVPFDAVDGAVLVLWSLGAQFLVILPAIVLGIVDGTPGPTMLLLVIVAQAVGLAGALAYLAARRRLSWRLLGPIRPSWTHAAYGLVIGIAGFLGIQAILAAILQLVGPVDPPDQQLLNDLLEGGPSLLLGIVAAVVMAPLVEEVVFRGVLYQGLKRRVGFTPAALVSSLIFAVVHVEVVPDGYAALLPLTLVLCGAILVASWPGGGPARAVGWAVSAACVVGLLVLVGSSLLYLSGLFLLGMVFAWFMHRFGSLIVPIVAHAAFNAVNVGLALLGGRFLDLVG